MAPDAQPDGAGRPDTPVGTSAGSSDRPDADRQNDPADDPADDPAGAIAGLRIRPPQRRSAVPRPQEKGPVRLRGWIVPGVEHRSVVLVDDDGCVLGQLQGCPPDLVGGGARVVVTGMFRHDVLSTAQQGVPFVVQAVDADRG